MTEQEIIDKVISFYPDLQPNIDPENNKRRGNPCSFAIFTDNYSVGIIDKYVCHSPIRNYINSGIYDQIITSLPRKTNIDLAFIHYLIEYPFKSYLDRISIESSDDVQYYLRIRDIKSIPPQILYNICISSRTPVEWGHYFFKLWSEFVVAGVHPMLAFILSQHKFNNFYDPDPLNYTFSELGGSDWHFWIDPVSNWINIIEGKPLPMSNSCLPCNSIWRTYTQKFFKSITGLTVRQICDKLGYDINPNPAFPKYEGKTYEY